jgi:uncharacterized protein (DUF2236 family)
MTVTRADLEHHIELVRAEVVEPAHGIYGPGSTSWRVDKEIVLFLGGGKAALLQLAHPYVAHAVDQHSATRDDPLGRFQRTFDNVWAMVFGDLDTAVRCARRVHAIHSRIEGEILEDVGAFRRGHRYHANDEQGLLWVHATLLETAVQVYELFVRPLEPDEKERFYAESKRFAHLFGLGDDVVPPTWVAFEEYFRRMLASDQIAVGEPARELGQFLFKSPNPRFRRLFTWIRIMTAGLMDERLRREFELGFGRSERAVFAASVALVRNGYRVLPPRLRHVPAYVRAQRRLKGIDAPDRLGALIEKLAMSPLSARKARV